MSFGLRSITLKNMTKIDELNDSTVADESMNPWNQSSTPRPPSSDMIITEVRHSGMTRNTRIISLLKQIVIRGNILVVAFLFSYIAMEILSLNDRLGVIDGATRFFLLSGSAVPHFALEAVFTIVLALNSGAIRTSLERNILIKPLLSISAIYGILVYQILIGNGGINSFLSLVSTIFFLSVPYGYEVGKVASLVIAVFFSIKIIAGIALLVIRKFTYQNQVH
jgi:hypothetical protein